MAISQRSATPKYRQLADLLRARITGGELLPGDQLPSEAQLKHSFQISRLTIRQALAELEQEGMLERVPGKGTFVRKRAHHVDRLTSLTGFGENIVALGMRPGYRVIRAEATALPSDVAQSLQVPLIRGFVVERLLLADGDPVAYHESFLPAHVVRRVGEGAFSAASLGQGSLYRLLESGGVRIHRADERVEPGVADATAAARLEMAEGDLVLRVTRTVFDPDGVPVEHVLLVYNAALYTYRTTLVR